MCIKQGETTVTFGTLAETKIADFANSVDLDEVAHNEPPHLDFHCLPSRLFKRGSCQLLAKVCARSTG